VWCVGVFVCGCVCVWVCVCGCVCGVCVVCVCGVCVCVVCVWCVCVWCVGVCVCDGIKVTLSKDSEVQANFIRSLNTVALMLVQKKITIHVT
jgi:hypothetical protein